jgi:hypothetical protein
VAVAKAPVLPPLTPLGRPAAELEAEGWKPVEITPELTRVSDSAPVELELGSEVRHRREENGSVRRIAAAV